MKFPVEVFRELTKVVSSKRMGTRVQLMALSASLVAIMLAMMSSSIMKFKHGSLRPKDYQQQIDMLNQTEQNIRQLVTFIESQKRKLAESEAIVSSLKEEESKLRPVVETDRQIVDAILDAQQERNRAYIWKERIISFSFGVIASIVAALLLTAISRARKITRQQKGHLQTTN